MPSGNSMRRAGLTDLTLPEDLIWTVPVTPLEEQLPQPTRAPPQRIPILKCGPASTRLVPPAAPDTRGLVVCAPSRVLVSHAASSAALRERRGSQAAAQHLVVSHVPSAPPELLQQCVMMSIPTIFNPNLNGMEPIPDFLPSPNETVGFKCAPRLPCPDCPMHRACPSRNDAREARAPSPHAMSPRHRVVCLICLPPPL